MEKKKIKVEKIHYTSNSKQNCEILTYSWITT